MDIGWLIVLGALAIIALCSFLIVYVTNAIDNIGPADAIDKHGE